MCRTTIHSPIVKAWSSAVLINLQTRMKKYERKAAQYARTAEEATDEPVRAFYEELAGYYGELAKDFRRVIAKQTTVSMAGE